MNVIYLDDCDKRQRALQEYISRMRYDTAVLKLMPAVTIQQALNLIARNNYDIQLAIVFDGMYARPTSMNRWWLTTLNVSGTEAIQLIKDAFGKDVPKICCELWTPNDPALSRVGAISTLYQFDSLLKKVTATIGDRCFRVS